MDQRAIPQENHEVYRENLATYLAHAGRTFPSARWTRKVERELAAPYTNQQVQHHLERLEDSLQQNLRELPAMPSRVYITGSFAKGRLGANSDLDGFMAIPKEHMNAGFDSYERREKETTGSNLFPLADDAPGYTRGHLLFAGQSVAFSADQLMKEGSLSEAYSAILKERDTDRIETSQTFEWITSKLWSDDKTAKEKRDAFENQSLKTRIQNAIMAAGGHLSNGEVTGPAFNWFVDKFAKQSHRDFSALP